MPQITKIPATTPSIDGNGNVTIVETVTSVYTASEYLTLQSNIQGKITANTNIIADLNTQLANITPVATQVNTALLALSQTPVSNSLSSASGAAQVSSSITL